MATTHAKIHAALKRAARRKQWTDIDELANDLTASDDEEFHLKGEALSEESIRRLIRLMLSLEFLTETSDGELQVTGSGRAAIPASAFNAKMTMAVRSYFDNKKLPIDKIMKAIKSIKLPNVPDADTVYQTVYDGIEDDDRIISKDLFRTLLLLYAKSDGMDRRVRIFYGEK